MHQDSQNNSFEEDTTTATGDGRITDALPSIRSPDCTSIDSGFGVDSVSRFGGSQTSIVSGAGVSPSPSLHYRLNMQPGLTTKETIPEHVLEPPPYECRNQSKLHSDVEKSGEVLWQFKDLQVKDSQPEIISALFRGTDKLITANKDGSVHLTDITKLEEPALTVLKSITVDSTVGSLDIWKQYLAVGSPDLKLVNLNSSGTLLGSKEGWEHPHLVAFTPRGNLLSYNRSQPGVIEIWPKVETLWSSPGVKSEKHLLRLKDINYIDSLTVSPNPSQPKLAVGAVKQLHIYDYELKTLTQQLDVDAEKPVASFPPNGKYIAVASRRQLQIHETESYSISFQFPKFDVSITSLAYNPWPGDTHLAVGLSNGEIHVYGVGPDVPNSKPELLVALDKSMASAAIKCLSYSKDGRTLAAVSGNSKVKLWKVPVKSRSEDQGISVVREGELKVDNKGKQYVSPDDGYAISIPPGAVPEGKTITFKHGVVPDGPFGPFEFPTGVRPVSAILSLHPTTEQPLLKPMEIALPHFIHCETQSDCNRLAVFKADCHSDKSRDGRQTYSFKEMKEINLQLGTYRGDHDYSEGIPYGKFSTDHNCYWCFCEKYTKEDTDRAIFSLIEVRPKVLDHSEDAVIHFCLPYFLPTCHKTIREQYPDEAYDLNIQSVKFSPEESQDNPAIGLDFSERLGEWLFSLQGGSDRKIYQQEVCFWDYPTPLYLKEMCREKLYPPRLSVCIRGIVRPNDVVMAEFKFPGAEAFPGRGEPVAIIHLPLPAQRLSVSTGRPVSRVNSGHSVMSETVFRAAPVLNQQASSMSHQSLQPAAQAFKKCMCDLDDLHPSKLAVNLFSKNLIDEMAFESIQESMKSPTKDEMVLRTEILLKVYCALKADPKLSTPIQEALRKLNPESAGKFASEMSRLSREGSLASTSSLVTAPERLSNEAETPADIIMEEHSSSQDLAMSGSPLASSTLTPLASSTLTPYSQMHFGGNLLGTLTFNTQTSLISADPCSEEAQPVAELERTTQQETVITSASD